MKSLDQFYSLLQPGWTVLDLGAGAGNQAKHMTDLGAKVVAVDKQRLSGQDSIISWNILSIEEWIDSLTEHDLFDAILARNSLQFFKKDFVKQSLLPILSNHLKHEGIFEIETFYKEPEPSFEKPFQSYWTEGDLKTYFTDWDIINSEAKKENGPDLKGKVRDFYKTGILVRKP